MPEISSEDDHKILLYQPTPYSIYTKDIEYTLSTQESQVNEAFHYFENSQSLPKYLYNSISDPSTETVSSSPLALGVGGIPAIRDEVLSKRLK